MKVILVPRIGIGRRGLITSFNVMGIMALTVACYGLYLMGQTMAQLEQRMAELSAVDDIERMLDEELLRTENDFIFPEQINPHNFSFTINHPDKCANEDVFLLIIVTTAPQYHRARFEIRQTWGNISTVSGVVVKTVFAVGMSYNRAIQVALERENAEHKDIIQEDFIDSYRNLTLKTVMCLKWAFQYCPQARFVMKADDDTFVNIFRLVEYLKELPSDTTKLVTGWVYDERRPLRDRDFIPKWYVSEDEYPRDVYPKYPSGFAYVLSNDTTKLIYETSLDTKYFFLEDVYIGLCLEKLGITPVHSGGFYPEFVPVPGCQIDWLLACHWVKEPDVMLNQWESLTTNC